jgi:hypothetical protein
MCHEVGITNQQRDRDHGQRIRQISCPKNLAVRPATLRKCRDWGFKRTAPCERRIERLSWCMRHEKLGGRVRASG